MDHIPVMDEKGRGVSPQSHDIIIIIMIAHRLKTVRHVDQILVVDEGHMYRREDMKN